MGPNPTVELPCLAPCILNPIPIPFSLEIFDFALELAVAKLSLEEGVEIEGLLDD